MTSQRQLATPAPSVNKFVAECGGPVVLCPTLTSALLRQMLITFGFEEHSTKLNAPTYRQAGKQLSEVEWFTFFNCLWLNLVKV